MQIKMYVEPFLAYTRAQGRCEKTIHEHRRFFDNVIIPALGDRELDSLRKIDSVLVESLGKNFGEHGAQRSVCLLRRLLNYIDDSGERMPFSWRELKLPRVPTSPIHALNDEEYEYVCSQIDTNTTAGLRLRTVVELLYASGMRIGELISINKTDIDWPNKEAEIVNVKTHNKEKIYFNDRSLMWLRRYLDKRRDNDVALFISGRGRLLEVTSRNYMLKFANKLEALGFKKHIHHHIFRKSYITKLLKNGVNIKGVQILGRHKSERTTLRHYTAVSVDEAKNEHVRVMCAA